MDLQHLRYFVAVAEELHFTRAARRLYVDQGALSAAIRRLERELGVTLFVRSSRAVELSSAGAALFPEAVLLLQRAEHLMSVALAHQPRRATPLRVGLFLGTQGAGDLTRPILDAFRAQHPQTPVQELPLDLLNWAPAVVHGFVDVAIVRGPVPHPDVEFTTLFEEPRTVVLAPHHPLAGAATLAPTELEPLQRDHWSRVGSAPTPFHDFYALGDVWDARDLSRDVPPPRDLAQIVGQVHSGSVVGVLPVSAARLLPVGVVRAVTLTGIAGATSGVAHRGDATTPEVRRFVRVARETTSRLIGLLPEATLPPSAPPPGAAEPGIGPEESTRA